MEGSDSSGWIVLQGSTSSYGDVEGVSYHFPTHIPNGTSGLKVGDLVACVRPQSEATAEGGRIFGVGRIGERSDASSEAEIFFDRYEPIAPPLSWDDVGGDPRNNKTNAIVKGPPDFFTRLLEVIGLSSIDNAATPAPVAPISSSIFEDVINAAGVDLESDEPEAAASVDALTVAGIETVLKERGLRFDGTTVVRECLVALRSGKHLILQGPPGTGKSTLAEALAEAARRVRVARGAVQLTGSSDWTPSDTVGTYRLGRSESLEFVPGQLLEAIATDHWAIIDELNRADIDRAMGPLFSVLSGQATVLRYEEERAGEYRRVAICPEESTMQTDAYSTYVVPSTWRILATMNTKDLDLLFEVSQAFLRRFAIVDVPPPSRAAHTALLSEYETSDEEVNRLIRRLAAVPEAALGPAITLDAARFIRTQWELDDEARPTVADLADQAYRLFVRPQLYTLDRRAKEAVREYLTGGGGDESADVGPTVDDEEGALDQ